MVAAITFVTVVGWHILKAGVDEPAQRHPHQQVLLEFGALGGPMTGVAEFFGAATLVSTSHLLSAT